MPNGFSNQALSGTGPKLTVVAKTDPSGQVATSALQTSLKRVLGTIEGARIGADILASKTPFADESVRAAYLSESTKLAAAQWKTPAIVVVTESAAGTTAQRQVPAGFAQSSPGMMVQFAVFSLITSAMVLALERRSKTMQRLVTTPTRRSEIIAGHLLAMFTVVILQEVLLIALGQFVFGVDYLREPAGTLLIMVMLALWAASLGLLIGAVARNEEHVVMLALIALFLFSALGGAWFSLEIAGKTFAAIGHVLPTAWAMEGFQNIVLRGGAFTSVLLPAYVLLAYAAVFFGLALWRFEFE